MNLTRDFTLEELTFSQAATRHKINNEPAPEIIENLKAICEKVLQPLRLLTNSPIKITSGYRSKPVNCLIGGVANSQHIKGEAVDCVATKHTVKGFYELIKLAVERGSIEVDQCILEYGRWVHISYSAKRRNRNQFLIKDD
jgi:hypothetical protein